MLGEPSARRKILAFMGFRAYVEPFELQRFRLLAELWDAQITVVDIPGCGYGRGKLRPHERRPLVRGDFSAVARRMVAAAQQHHPALRTAPVTVLGYSLGASLAASAAGHRMIPTDCVVLVEPVSIRRWPVWRLLAAVHAENAKIDQFVARNAGRPNYVAPLAIRGDSPADQSPLDLTLTGWAISRGRIVDDLVLARGKRAMRVLMVHGNDSRLVCPTDITRAAARCGAAGMNVDAVEVDGGHALWHSLPDVEAMARRLVDERW
jgi:pimeloyl-ACP methyl ester carboxylesterase